MVSINSTIAFDRQGQVAADALGPKQFSGVGGQVNFVRGANRSKGVRSIIALPSTAARGKASRIVAALDRGQPDRLWVIRKNDPQQLAAHRPSTFEEIGLDHRPK